MPIRCFPRPKASQITALYRQFCKEKGIVQPPAPPSGPPKDHVAKREYGFMESADIIFSEPTKQSWHRRWDWHAWQLLIALVPSLFIYSMAQYARREMQRLTEERNEKAMAAERVVQDEMQREADLQDAQNQEILNRIQSLEADMRALRALKVQIGQSGVNAKDEQRSQSRESPRAAQRDGR